MSDAQNEEQRKCRRTALRLLARREHTAANLTEKLLHRGFDPGLVDQTIAWLQEKEYVSDERFAREWIRWRLRQRPMGVDGLLANLRRKGVAHDLARRCIEEEGVAQREHQLALRALEEHLRRKEKSLEDPRELRRAKAYLARRGFTRQAIVQALELMQTTDDQDCLEDG